MNNLPPNAIQRIADFLPSNDIATHIRFTCKYFSFVLSGPRCTTVALREPVRACAFAARWGSDSKVSQLCAADRLKLVRQTATSGVLVNLQAVLNLPCDRFVPAAPGKAERVQAIENSPRPPVTQVALEGAAAGGHLELCRWLAAEHGAIANLDVAVSAAKAGQLEVLEWALECGPEEEFWFEDEHYSAPMTRIVCAAAEAGHGHVVQSMAAQWPWVTYAAMAGAAWGGHVPLVLQLLNTPCKRISYDTGHPTEYDTACHGSSLDAVDWVELAWALMDAAAVGADLSPVLDVMASSAAYHTGSRSRSRIISGSGSDEVCREGAEVVLSDVWWLALLSALARPAGPTGNEWRARADWLYDRWQAVAGGRGRVFRTVYDECVKLLDAAPDAAARLGWLRDHGLGPEEVAQSSSGGGGGGGVTRLGGISIVHEYPALCQLHVVWRLPGTLWRGVASEQPMGASQWLDPIHDGNLLMHVRGFMVDRDPL